MDEVIFFSHSAHQHGAINDWLKVSPNRYRIKKKSKKKKILKCFWVISHYQAFFFFFFKFMSSLPQRGNVLDQA